MKTATRHIPSYCSTEQLRTEAGAMVYYGSIDRQGKVSFLAMGFRSDRQVKPDFYLSFQTEQRREAKVTEWLEGLRKSADFKQERQDKRKEASNRPNPFKVGDIFYRSWGYDQTNVNFYQVTVVKGKSVVVHEIASQSVPGREGGFMSDHVVAVKDAFLSSEQPMTKLVKWSTWDDEPKAYLHFLIDYPPTLTVTSIVRRIKSMSTIRIWDRLENYLLGQFWKERTFWSDGYFACSVGDASADTIRRYIEEQG